MLTFTHTRGPKITFDSLLWTAADAEINTIPELFKMSSRLQNCADARVSVFVCVVYWPFSIFLILFAKSSPDTCLQMFLRAKFTLFQCT